MAAERREREESKQREVQLRLNFFFHFLQNERFSYQLATTDIATTFRTKQMKWKKNTRQHRHLFPKFQQCALIHLCNCFAIIYCERCSQKIRTSISRSLLHSRTYLLRTSDIYEIFFFNLLSRVNHRGSSPRWKSFFDHFFL